MKCFPSKLKSQQDRLSVYEYEFDSKFAIISTKLVRFVTFLLVGEIVVPWESYSINSAVIKHAIQLAAVRSAALF